MLNCLEWAILFGDCVLYEHRKVVTSSTAQSH